MAKTYKLTLTKSDDTTEEITFTIPQGDKGATGDKGDKGATGDNGAAGAAGVTVTAASVTLVS